MVIRSADRCIRAFYNTCRHRGAPLVQQESGTVERFFSYGYHGWTYDTVGTLTAAPDPRDWANLDRSCQGLVPLRCELLGNWIFICKADDGPSLNCFLDPIAGYFRHLPLPDSRLVHQRSVEIRGNYKIVLENFLEAYHFRLLHQNTTDRIFDNTGTSIHLWKYVHSFIAPAEPPSDWVDPGTIGMPEIATATTIERDHNPSYHVFPNIILPIAPTGLPRSSSGHRSWTGCCWASSGSLRIGAPARANLFERPGSPTSTGSSTRTSRSWSLSRNRSLRPGFGACPQLPGAVHLPLAQRTGPPDRRGPLPRTLARTARPPRLGRGRLRRNWMREDQYPGAGRNNGIVRNL